MKTAALCFGLVCFVLHASVWCLEPGKRPSSPAAEFGTFRGQVGAAQKSGTVVPATSATVYVMYASGTYGRRTYDTDTDTAGRHFTEELHKLLGPLNKQMKELTKDRRADVIARLYLAATDQALAATTEFVTRHPQKAWQVRTIEPDAEGFWSAEGLKPGGYAILVRGAIAGHDADWEGSVDVDRGQTISVPLTTPRFFRL